MKTPLWESSPGALAALLNGMRTGPANFVRAHLYTFNLAGGGQLTFTDADLDVSVPALTPNYWSSKGVRVDLESSRATAHWKRGLDVDTWLVVVAPRPVDPITGAAFPDKIGGVPWIQAAWSGALAGADVFVDRAYFPGWPQPWAPVATPTGVLRIFAGQPAEVDVGDLMVAITLNDYRQRLSTNTPTGIFQAGCRHTLFDAGCTLVAATLGVTSACIGGTTRAILKSPAAPPPSSSGTFVLGRIAMTSGANNGFQRTVRDWAPGSFSLLNKLPFDVLPGDTFTAYPGCDKQLTTCTKFVNAANFGGEPFIPAAETAV